LYPFSHLSLFSWFLPLAPLFISFFFMKLVTLVSHIYFLCVCFYPHRNNFQTDSTVPVHSMVLVRLQMFLCLYLLFVFLNRRLLFCNTVYCTSLLCGFRFTNFSPSWQFHCLAPRNYVLSSWLASRYCYSCRFPLQMAIHSA
jgi:hypothetical protein